MCPLTFTGFNKFAHGDIDNFAVGLLCEMVGYGVPVVVVPHYTASALRAWIGLLNGAPLAWDSPGDQFCCGAIHPERNLIQDTFIEP